MRRPFFIGLALSASLALAACGGAATPIPAPASPATSPAASAVASAAASAAASQAAAAGGAVTIANFAFAPASATVKAGATVTWTNQDSAGHSVKWDDGTATSETIATGASYTRTFAAAGTFAYICGIHPSMKGTIVVS